MSDWNPEKPNKNYFSHPASSNLAEATQLEHLTILDHLTYLHLGNKWARKAASNEAKSPEVRESARKLVEAIDHNDAVNVANVRFIQNLRNTLSRHAGEKVSLTSKKAAQLLEQLVLPSKQDGLPPLRTANGLINPLSIKKWGAALLGFKKSERVNLTPLLEDFFFALASAAKGTAPDVSGMSYRIV